MTAPPPIDPLWRQYITDLDRQRRAGWARVARLEAIITAYSHTAGLMARVILEHASGDLPDDETTRDLSAWLDELDRIDPPDRDRWPTSHRPAPGGPGGPE
jgi:hypothetical protein